MKELVKLFWSFFKIGLLTFGGGYSMLPMIKREAVEKHKWVSDEEVLQFFALSQCMPGIIAVKNATLIGCSAKGFLGGIAASAGVVLPSFLVLLIIAMLLSEFMHLEIVAHAFNGIRIGVAALIVNVVIRLFKSFITDIATGLVFIAVFVSVAFFNLSPILAVVASLIFGLASSLWRKNR